MLYEKREEDHSKVLDFIYKHFPDVTPNKLSDKEGILHGYEIADSETGDYIVVGYDHEFDQVMYIRYHSPLAADAYGLFKDDDDDN